jgi:hypothetical protein
VDSTTTEKENEEPRLFGDSSTTSITTSTGGAGDVSVAASLRPFSNNSYANVSRPSSVGKKKAKLALITSTKMNSNTMNHDAANQAMLDRNESIKRFAAVAEAKLLLEQEKMMMQVFFQDPNSAESKFFFEEKRKKYVRDAAQKQKELMEEQERLAAAVVEDAAATAAAAQQQAALELAERQAEHQAAAMLLKRKEATDLLIKRNEAAVFAEAELMKAIKMRNDSAVAEAVSMRETSNMRNDDSAGPEVNVTEATEVIDWSDVPKGATYLREVCAGYGCGDIREVMEQFHHPQHPATIIIKKEKMAENNCYSDNDDSCEDEDNIVDDLDEDSRVVEVNNDDEIEHRTFLERLFLAASNRGTPSHDNRNSADGSCGGRSKS